MNNEWIGTGVALVTPFYADLSIDYDALSRLIDHCIDGGVEYLVTLGTTGESVTLSPQEKQALIRFTVERVDGRVPVVAGFGGSNTQAIIEDLQDYDLNGISAILSSSPNYNKPTQDGLLAHYAALAKATEKPIILYNVPGRTAKNMEASTTLQLASSVDNIIGIKEASGDVEQCMEIVSNRPNDFLCISGEDLLTQPLVCAGFDGVISVVANACPKLFSDMVRLAREGKAKESAAIHYKLLPLIKALFKENNPGGIKAALAHLGICETHVRLPLVPISQANSTLVNEALDKI